MPKALHTIRSELFLNCSRQTAWEFICNPANLATITPDYMSFKILHGTEMPIYEGKIIEYTVKPLFNFPLHWVTEITHMKEGEYFVDEQRFGPYAFWHHQHHLRDTPGGVVMSDIVHYRLPLGFVGRLTQTLLVKKQLEGIFSYRKNKLDELFNTKHV